MNSPEKWGLGLILVGVMFLVVFYVKVTPAFLGAVYGLPLIAMGIALIIFRNRESKLDK
ncbi:MAG: hypothetical protein ACP5E4_03700 [Candidatus Aenigmatarchaeota archaeon]